MLQQEAVEHRRADEEVDYEATGNRTIHHLSGECLTNKHLVCCQDDCPCICHRDEEIMHDCSKRYKLHEERLGEQASSLAAFRRQMKPSVFFYARYLEKLADYVTSPLWQLHMTPDFLPPVMPKGRPRKE